MSTQSGILAWEIPWSLAGYSPCGHKIVGHDLVTKQQTTAHQIRRQTTLLVIVALYDFISLE